MSSRLTRRALFALPVALPVAAVAAKVAPVKPFAMGGVVDPAKFAHIIGERGPEAIVPVRMEIDGAALRRVLKAEADRIISRFDPAAYRVSAGMIRREGAAEAAKPVTAQALREEGADLPAVAAGRLSEPSAPAEQSVNPYPPSERASLVTTKGKARVPAESSPGEPEVARVVPPVPTQPVVA